MNTLSVVFLTIDIMDVPIKVSGIYLNVTHQIIHIQAVLFSNLSLDFSSQSFKFWSKFAILPAFLGFSKGFIFFCTASFSFQEQSKESKMPTC